MTDGAKRAMFAIIGMRGNDCRERVADALGQVEGVHDVTVSLIRAMAVVVYEPPCEIGELVRAVEDVGYGAALK